MSKMLKHAAKDTTGFILILITGACIGAAFTAAHLKYDIKTSISFADIGGMLAGLGTVGLLLLAWRTIYSWREQNEEQEMRESLNEFYISASSAYLSLLNYKNHLSQTNFEKEIFTNFSALPDGCSISDYPQLKDFEEELKKQNRERFAILQDKHLASGQKVMGEFVTNREALIRSCDKLSVVWSVAPPILICR